ncbi:MAG: hypothetical protein KDA84_16755 [Planctomycetaceae bacterium]|nr:hypothetical protein [Planctomycetaceae bacterium]
MTEQRSKPIRIAVYKDVSAAATAIRDLQDAGFTQDEISVLCSDQHRKELFKRYIHEEPSGSHNDEALNRAGLAALGLGGAAAITGIMTSAGTAIFAIGAFAGVAAVTTFVSLMLTRGAEKELADFYDQAVLEGNILVAVETDDSHRGESADQVFQKHGSSPISIPSESSP